MIIALTLAFSVLNLLPAFHWWQEINVNLSFFYLALHVFSLLYLLCRRRRTSALTRPVLIAGLFFMAVYYFSMITPFYRPVGDKVRGLIMPPCSSNTHPPCKLWLLYANLRGRCGKADELNALVQAVRPQVVALLGLNRCMRNALHLDSQYQQAFVTTHEDTSGLALYSIFPMAEARTSLGEFLPSVLLADLEISPKRRLKTGLLYAEPPYSAETLENNRILFRRMTGVLRHERSDVVAAADLQATPFSGLYKRFVYLGRMINAMSGFGLRGGLSGGNILSPYTTSHLFYRGKLEVERFLTQSSAWSRHRSYLVEFAVLP